MTRPVSNTVKSWHKIGVAAIIMLSLSSCATMPQYSAAEVCSADWIKPRTDKAMTQFKSNSKSVFKNLKKAGTSAAKGSKPGPIQMFMLMSSLKKLGNQFEHGQAMKDMRTLASTCDKPKLIQNAMTDVLREYQVDEKFISFLNGFEGYTEMLRTGKKPALKL